MAEKAQIVNDDTDEKIDVMYNPNEYTLSRSAEVSGEGTGITFGKVNMNDFTVTLFFDTYEEKLDVREKTNKITDLIIPAKEGTSNRRPHFCSFVWGKNIFKGVIIKVDQKFTMFLATGVPVRADLTVTFKSAITADEHKKLMGQSSSRKYWTVKSGDRLDLIAGSTLNNPALWRVIADTNGIKDPFNFPAEDQIGKVLMIPNYYHMAGTE